MAKSVMVHSFSQVPKVDIPRSSFDRSHGLKTTFDADFLIPILVDDVIPGDTFNVNCNFVARLATPLFPLMDNLYLETFFFFVPYRLVWDNWEKFCGAQDNPADTISFTIPVCTGTNSQTGEGTLWDYFGLPLTTDGTVHFDPDDLATSCLPFRAYSLIYNEWFRDQNLQDGFRVDTDDGPDAFISGQSTTSLSKIPQNPLKRGKRHDYFTSCLPWPQKQTLGVTLPLGTTAPVTTDAAAGGDISVFSSVGAVNKDLVASNANVELDTTDVDAGAGVLYADLSTATAATINELRLAFQTQRLLERDARSGTRYVETILAHYGVTVPDFRVQRPEFLGGGSTPIQVNQVAATTDTAAYDIGQLAAYGVVSGSHGFTKSFTEHGVIIGLANVRSDITYHQGQERYWAKSTRYDFYYPVLSQIGEQSVPNKEIYAQGDGATNDTKVFGYQERYAEYRYKPSRLTNLMNPNSVTTLAAWNLSEDFATLPTLGSTFILSNTGTPLDRAIATPAEPHFIADFYFSMKCARPMPLYGVPGNLDHF